jgi:phosphoglycolate phosphatase
LRVLDLLHFDHISIQCHDNPDADAIASGFGVYSFLKAKSKDARLFYGGKNAISKPNLVAMLRLLNIPLEYLPDLKSCEGLLLTVDCQYGAGNVSRVEAPYTAIIDHHIQEMELPPLAELKPMLGSCATLVWSMLRQENFELSRSLSTALYYGLFTDSNSFAELRHPLDRDMWDSLIVEDRILKKLKGSNLSLGDLNLASEALSSRDYLEDGRVMIVGAPPCDPNILGFISDLAMQVESVDIALVFSNQESGYKFSVRTDTRNARAAEIVGDIIPFPNQR